MPAARLVFLALSAVMILAAGPAYSKTAKAPAKLAGKVFVTADPVKDLEPTALVRQFMSASGQSTLGRKSNGHWVGTIVGFFKKPSVPGPIIVWVFDKADKEALQSNEPVQAVTVESSPREVFVHEMDYDPDQGYNKDHSYLIRLGQIISKKIKIYAVGEVKLLK